MTLLAEELPDLAQFAIAHIPYGLVSLLGMFNCEVWALCQELRLLKGREDALELRMKNPRPFQSGDLAKFLAGTIPEDRLSDQEMESLRKVLKFIEHIAKQFEMDAVLDRVNIFIGKLVHKMTIQEICVEIRVIREIIESNIKERYFYHYPRDKARLLIEFNNEWGHIIKAFPGAREDAIAAVDCYALGHNTAAVFHSMRIAEHGMRALAKERKIRLPRNKPIEWANWQDIIKELTTEGQNILNRNKAGAAKDRALEFYSGAVADLNGFKDEYRNLVMHVRKTYDELQSLRALQRVHAFMSRVSEKIDYRHHRIRWGLR